MTDIFDAIRKGDVASAKQHILAHGVDHKDKDGWPLLHLAALHGKDAVAQLLLDKGVDINAVDGKGSTALHQACWDGKTTIAQLLVEKGANIHVKNGLLNTALHFAAGRGHMAIVQCLCWQGARLDKNQNGKTPIELAESKDFPEIAAYIRANEARLAGGSGSGSGAGAAAAAGPCVKCAERAAECDALQAELAKVKAKIADLEKFMAAASKKIAELEGKQ